MSDTDVAWLRNPAELLQQEPEADIMISTDCLNTAAELAGLVTTPRCGHTPGSTYYHAFNTGVVLLRNNARTIKLVQEWSSRLGSRQHSTSKVTGDAMTDQLTLNLLLRENTSALESVNPDKGSRVVWAWGKQVKVLPLPTLVVLSGQNAFVSSLHRRYGSTPYAIHATFQTKGGQDGKVARFREAGLWLMDPPQYFSQGRFLTYQNNVGVYVTGAAEAWQQGTGREMALLHKHLLGAAYQRQVLSEALAMAHALNRTLVPPSWVCWCEQDWEPLVLTSCSMYGSDSSMPYRCPSDYLMNANLVGADLAMYIRFPGFLEDERVPITLRRSIEYLYLYPSEQTAAAVRSNHSHIGGAFAFGASDVDLRAAALLKEQARVVHLGPLAPGVFGGFKEQQDAAVVKQRVTALLQWQLWCCAAKDWDKGQYPFAIIQLADPDPLPTLGSSQAPSSPSSSSSSRGGGWVPLANISTTPYYCDSDQLLPVTVNYTKLQQHPCTYARGGVPLQQWNAALGGVLQRVRRDLMQRQGSTRATQQQQQLWKT